MNSPTLADLETLAHGAGQILRAGYGKSHQIDLKGEIDLVTEIDRETENYLLGVIQSRFSDHTIFTEESGFLPGQDSQVWYIDPLDGTVNYAHGVPIFSVSIAYAENGRVVLGAIFDPMQDEFFCTERGKGVWLNGKPIQVSEIKDLNSSLLVTGFPYDIRTNPNTNLDHYANLSLLSQGVRRLGSAAIDLAYVASGRLDGFWETSIHSWDIAAGALMVEEAGGKVTNMRGGPDYLSPPSTIIATNARIHNEMFAALNGQ